MTSGEWWNLEIESKPDFEIAMKRIYAWFEHEVIDRPPIRFSEHNSDFSASHTLQGRSWPDLKSKWFDAEFHLDFFMESIRERRFSAETFPIFWPNLGPEVYAGFYGAELEFQEVTSYSIPLVKEWDEMHQLSLDTQNEYFKKLEEMTELALQACKGKFMVGYTDLHGSTDIAAAFRDPQQFCMDILLNPQEATELIRIAAQDFQFVYDHFDNMLKKHNQLSVTWMGIPSFGKLHIPSCDFAAMISPHHFEEFCYQPIVKEVKSMNHNIFHIDGKGVARNLDLLLDIDEIQAYQWVQGMGLDMPIMQWVPLIKRIQDAGKSVVIDLQFSELEDFIASVDRKGIYLCIAADEALQPDIIRRVEKW